MTIGFIGTGHITSALVEGLSADEQSRGPILLSPRNRARSTALAARLTNVSVAADNQAVLDGAEVVMLAVRPDVAPDVVGALRFRPDHLVISLIALRPHGEMATLVHPATALHRAVPLPSTARRLGPIAYFPEDARVEALLATVGTPVAARDEAEFHRLWSLTGLLSPYYAVMEALADWTEAGGVPTGSAKRYITTLFHAMAEMARDPDATYGGLSEAAATPGGINEQGLEIIAGRDAIRPWTEATEAVFERMQRGRGDG
jgi:pyrroline-5-carboxylate reductase